MSSFKTKFISAYNSITGLTALCGLGFLLLEHTAWLSARPVLVRQINLSILWLFATDVLFNVLTSKKRKEWLRGNWFDLVVFVPLIQFFYAPPDSTLSVVLRQTAILAMLLSRTRRAKKFITLFSLQPAHLMLASFAGVIVFGTVLLMLPSATAPGQETTLLNAFFTATSATCVTGLIVYDTPTHFTFFGQLVILAMIQTGGLGIMTFSVSLAMLIRRSFSMKNQSIMQNVLDQETLLDSRRLIVFIAAMTLLLEIIGAVTLYLSWRPILGAGASTVWHAVFHSVSAFCNAGFSTFTDSLMRFSTHLPTNLTICLLIVLGGVGFVVIQDFYQALRNRLVDRQTRHHRFRIQTRLVLGWTGGLILAGTVLTFLIERHHLLAGAQTPQVLLTSLFQSITTRTAGFNTCAINGLQPATLFLFICLMFIGASPGGTGGGIKTTTAAVLWGVARAGLTRREKTELYRRTIPVDVIRRAIIALCASLLVVCVSLVVITLLEPQTGFLDLLFEIVSAFGTVGLSTGVTGSLSSGGRLLITLLMFIGRLGPLTLSFAFIQTKKRSAKYSYAEERLMIG